MKGFGGWGVGVELLTQLPNSRPQAQPFAFPAPRSEKENRIATARAGPTRKARSAARVVFVVCRWAQIELFTVYLCAYIYIYMRYRNRSNKIMHVHPPQNGAMLYAPRPYIYIYIYAHVFRSPLFLNSHKASSTFLTRPSITSVSSSAASANHGSWIFQLYKECTFVRIRVPTFFCLF